MNEAIIKQFLSGLCENISLTELIFDKNRDCEIPDSLTKKVTEQLVINRDHQTEMAEIIRRRQQNNQGNQKHIVDLSGPEIVYHSNEQLTKYLRLKKKFLTLNLSRSNVKPEMIEQFV